MGNSRTFTNFGEQSLSGKAFAYGSTVLEQPVTYLHIKKHFTSAQPEETMQKYIQYAVESCRLLMMPPADKVTLVFNVEGFGLKNMDWQTVTYVLNVLEKFYPECLGTLYVLNAPWLFNGFWKGLAPMLDPVVRAKMQFIKSPAEAAGVIPAERFLASLGGKANYTYKHCRYQPGENALAQDSKTYAILRARRDQAWHAYTSATQEWCRSANSIKPPAQRAILDRRRLLAKKIRLSHFDMEPYYRPLTGFDRRGIVDRQGLVTWLFPQKDSETVLRQVCGRLHCATTLRRELDEIENQEYTLDAAEAKSRTALQKHDWVTLYGSVELAQQIEGPDRVQVLEAGDDTGRNPPSLSTCAQPDPPRPQLPSHTPSQPSLDTAHGAPRDASSNATIDSASTPIAMQDPPTAPTRPRHNRHSSTSSARSVDSFASALSEMPEEQAGSPERNDTAKVAPRPRRLPGRPFCQIGGPMALEIGREQASPSPGTAGNLTNEERLRLREMWAAYFACKRYAETHSTPASLSASDSGIGTEEPTRAPASAAESVREGDLRFAAGSPSALGGETLTASVITEEVQQALDSLVDAYGASAMEHIWEFIKMDNPDSLILRFLRARDWNVPDALVMAIDCIKWRLDFGVEDLVRGGDWGNAAVHEKFNEQQRLAKSYARGHTSATQQPVCYIHVGKHVTSAQPPETMEKFVVYAMETFRLLMCPPQEKATLFFDLSGFGLKNMDWNTVGFIIKCFESFYPECLGTLFVHKAPWLFWGIWHGIAPLLDPVVRSKIIFSSSAKDSADKVPPGRLLAALGGNVDNGFSFLEPLVGENSLLEDHEGRARAQARYKRLAKEYEDVTRQWIASEGQDPGVNRLRAILTKQLRVAQFDLEPYVRGQTVYHRNGTLDGQGKVTWLYRQKDGHLIRHVVGRISCVGTLEREIQEIQAGTSVEEAERTSSEALKAADWLMLYGDPAVANHLEGTSYPVEGEQPPSPVETREQDPVAVAAAAAAAATTPTVASGAPSSASLAPPEPEGPHQAGARAETSWTESMATSVTGIASDFTEKMSNLQDFALNAPSTLQDFLATPYQRTASPAVSMGGGRRSSSTSRRSSRRLSTQVLASLSGWDVSSGASPASRGGVAPPGTTPTMVHHPVPRRAAHAMLDASPTLAPPNVPGTPHRPPSATTAVGAVGAGDGGFASGTTVASPGRNGLRVGTPTGGGVQRAHHQPHRRTTTSPLPWSLSYFSTDTSTGRPSQEGTSMSDDLASAGDGLGEQLSHTANEWTNGLYGRVLGRPSSTSTSTTTAPATASTSSSPVYPSFPSSPGASSLAFHHGVRGLGLSSSGSLSGKPSATPSGRVLSTTGTGGTMAGASLPGTKTPMSPAPSPSPGPMACPAPAAPASALGAARLPPGVSSASAAAGPESALAKEGSGASGLDDDGGARVATAVSTGPVSSQSPPDAQGSMDLPNAPAAPTRPIDLSPSCPDEKASGASLHHAA